MKPGRIVIVVAGRYAGKKGVILKCYDDGNKPASRNFGHCLVAGIAKNPLKVTTRMSKEKVEKRLRIKPFLKYVNYNHIMPTRYTCPAEAFGDVKTLEAQDRVEARKALKTVMKEKVAKLQGAEKEKGKIGAGKDFSWFRQRLRF
ncbi:unnamed protein product [Vitrella brassicaformis CCMP3155]|uniref:KOW domain-containing protein n=2 Tax=Vitrella brassicaformis TaxID=1169539 RepID=A0A0G4FVN2_VITBC|nr:unnamed protein product [Vitrella brassicaformis CCMP3155]|eukprot:CEM19212.1 unnamed protein product [Vitrella brassicaformis CCMP3155]